MAQLELGNYPLPADAVALYLDDNDQLRIVLPGARSDGHVVALPATPHAMPALVQILKDRRAAPVPPTIGEAGAPTSVMVEEFLRRNPPKPAPAPAAPVEFTASELDALLSELD